MTAQMGELGVVNSNGGGGDDVSTAAAEERLPLETWRISPPPDPTEISEECWSAAEVAAEQVLNWVHPTLDSEEKRRDVIDYVQELVKTRLNCEVVTYGSVPLKTYLPDGDIDLTVLKRPNAAGSLPHDVLALIQQEEQIENSDFQVKDTLFIDAEVKLVKCLIDNTVIDISFNQLGGLSTLCFLEQVDRFVGRNHLFKRSIILVKTWCYYESRILGAHHGLISTYALEALVLYIFHHFYSSATGPLAVLYKFMEYYSEFDWDNYCISLKGPVCKSSLPNIVVKMPENGGDNVLLTEEFLDNCMELFSDPLRGLNSNQKTFQSKHLNIIDPLKDNNNLGRSVHRGNYFRIRSAFRYGAHKLGQLLLQPRDTIAAEIVAFFANTSERHGSQYIRGKRLLSLKELGDGEEDESYAVPLSSSPVELLSDDDMLNMDSYASDFDNESFGVEITGGKYGTSDYISTSHYSSSLPENHFYLQPKVSSSKSSSENEEKDVETNNNNTHILDDPSVDSREADSTSDGVESEDSYPLADLSGDYDSDIRSLLRGQLTKGFTLSSPVVHNNTPPPPPPLPPPPPSMFHNRHPWDIVRQSMPLPQNGYSHMNPYPISAAPDYHTVYPHADPLYLGTAFQYDGMPKARGTGTFFPPMNPFYAEKFPHGRGRNRAPGYHYNDQFRRYGGNSNGGGMYNGGESNLFGNARRFQARRRKPEIHWQPHRGNQNNDYVSGSCRVEFGSVGNIGNEVVSGSHRVRGLNLGGPPLKTHHGSSHVMMRERFGGQSIHLKNEEEFPPLCQ